MKKCQNCKERHIGCHDHCESYQEWKKEQNRIAKAKQKYQLIGYKGGARK